MIHPARDAEIHRAVLYPFSVESNLDRIRMCVEHYAKSSGEELDRYLFWLSIEKPQYLSEAHARLAQIVSTKLEK